MSVNRDIAPKNPDYRDIPVYINNRDRVSCTSALVEWLLNAGHTNITIFDNDSTYPPLLAWYKMLPAVGVNVIFFGENLGAYALWEQPDKSLLKPPFILTDSDIVPDEGCPSDLVDFLLRTWEEKSKDLTSWWNCRGPIQKIGPMLKTTDIPNHFALKGRVLNWKKKHWVSGIKWRSSRSTGRRAGGSYPSSHRRSWRT